MAVGADGVRVAYPLFQTDGSGSTPTSALQFRFELIPFEFAKRLNAKWHSRLPKFQTGCVSNMLFDSYSADFLGVSYAIAIWSNPVARLLPQIQWLELRRFAIGPDAPRNTASRMLSFMTRDIKRRRPIIERLISYQDVQCHRGTIYKAAGWSMGAKHAGGSWNRPNSRNANGTPRTRPDSNGATSAKIRWELGLTTRKKNAN